jgi:hypothetical protein
MAAMALGEKGLGMGLRLILEEGKGKGKANMELGKVGGEMECRMLI